MYWNNTGTYQDLYDRHFAKLVPKSGEAGTPHGELLRVMTNITYRFYNDGDATWFDVVHMGACDEYYAPPYDAPADVRQFFADIREECALYNRQLWAFDNRSDEDGDEMFEPDVKRFTSQELDYIMDLIVLYVEGREHSVAGERGSFDSRDTLLPVCLEKSSIGSPPGCSC